MLCDKKNALGLTNKMDLSPKVGVKIKMIRWICDHTRLDKLRNEGIEKHIKVATIEDKMRGTKLRWIYHLKSSSVEALVRRCETIYVPKCRRGRGRP